MSEDDPDSEHSERKPLDSSRRQPSRHAEVDEETLQRCVAGDKEALNVFAEIYYKPVKKFLVRRLPPGHNDLEDAIQDVFVGAANGLGSFTPSPKAKVSTWLLKIASNVANDRWRTAKRRRKAPEDTYDEEAQPSSSSSPEDAVRRKRVSGALARCLDRLPEEQREALLLFYGEGRSLEEISMIRGAPVNTVKTRLFRARLHMQDYMKGYIDEYKK